MNSDESVHHTDDISEYGKEYDDGVKAIHLCGANDTTYSHRIRSCMDVQKPENAKKFFDEFTENNLPVYILGITNNEGDFDEHARNLYVRLRTKGEEVLLGQWVSPKGTIYRDISLAISGITQEQALKYKTKYAQLTMVEIRKDDPPRFL